MYFKEKLIINLLITLVFTVIVPILLGTILNNYFPSKFISIPLHSLLETSGGIIAILISMSFYIKYSKNLVLTHFNYMSIALLVMGIIDIFHASVMPGKLFVWLHSSAVFFGGILFISVWLKEKLVSKEFYRLVPILFSVFPILFSLFSIYFIDQIPEMLNSDNRFTTSANILNIIGGIGFFIASVKFMLNYIKTREIDEILFAGHTMLFGVAGLLFVSSGIWDLQWWLWHLLRLCAYAIAFYYVYLEFRNEVLHIETTNKELEIANNKIVEHLEIFDKYIITSSTDTKGIIRDVSQAFCDISGYSKEELIGKSHNIVKHPKMSHKVYEELWKTIRSGKVWHGEILNKRKDGVEYWVDSIITPHLNEEGKIDRYIALRTDITNQKIIEILSITDQLTNLYNKRHFNDVIEVEIQRAKRDKKSLNFMMMDIDHFKLYNDSYGHQEGDFVLQKIGDILIKNTKRNSDFAFRVGGEEFGVLFSGLNETESKNFAQNILEDIESLKIEHRHNTASKYVTASAGLLVQKYNDIQSAREIYLQTDQLLYKAKNNGRNQLFINK